MQLICEAYWLLKTGAGLSNDQLAGVFDEWNRGELDSYLIEITRDIFTVKDPDSGDFMVDLRTQKGVAAKALELTILTAARSGEVRMATWGEVDLQSKTWTIPASRMKAGVEHRVPLADAVVELLRQMPQQVVGRMARKLEQVDHRPFSFARCSCAAGAFTSTIVPSTWR
jgi:integrase